MKKTKLLCLLLVSVILASALSSCASSLRMSEIRSFNDLYPDEFEAKTDAVYTSAKELTELKGMFLHEANSELALFISEKAPADFYDQSPPDTATLKIFSLSTQSVVLTLEPKISETTLQRETYTVSLCNDMPAFIVQKNEYLLGSAANKSISTLYAADGTELARASADGDVTPYCFDDTLIFNHIVFKLNESRKLVDSGEIIPETNQVFVPDFYNDQYLYRSNSDTVKIYDRKFNHISSWQADEVLYEEDFVSNLLSNGNILVQYFKQLPSEDSNYDIFYNNSDGITEKYNMISLIIDAESGKEKEVELDYFVEKIEIIENVGNVAFMLPIVDKQIMAGDDANYEMALLSDNCKTAKSLLIADQQYGTAIPERIGEELYSVKTCYGKAVVDHKGKLVYPISSYSIKTNSKYLIGTHAIYDIATNESVYDLNANNATVLYVTSSSVFILKEVDDKQIISIFKDGTETEIKTFESKEFINQKFFTIASQYSYIPCYAIIEAKSAPSFKYIYYSIDGTELFDAKVKLTAANGADFSTEKYGTTLLYDEYGTTHYLIKTK